MNIDCETCRHFRQLESSPGEGACRKESPKIVDKFGRARWPIVSKEADCGDHQIARTKVISTSRKSWFGLSNKDNCAHSSS